ncbi:MAG: GntR family transcriptional regulator [Paracoccaceae bacterium]|nr:MAG: GntR family transcriptional regulator [Paracoccaceae bacterium]
MDAPPIAPIEQRNLRENAYAALRDAFIRGAFAPGTVLNLRALADQLGVSITPVREAVRRLVAEGALEDTPSRTLRVPDADPARMLDLKHGRLALEGLVAGLAFDRMEADAVARLEAVLARPSRDADGLPDLRQNYLFHFTLYRMSRSRVLLPLVEALWLQYGALLNRAIHQPRARVVAENCHHREMLEALRARDRAGLLEALARDIERSFALVAG